MFAKDDVVSIHTPRLTKDLTPCKFEVIKMDIQEKGRFIFCHQ